MSSTERVDQQDIPLATAREGIKQQYDYDIIVTIRVSFVCYFLKYFLRSVDLCAGGHKVGAGSGHGDTVCLSLNPGHCLYVIMSYVINNLSKVLINLKMP